MVAASDRRAICNRVCLLAPDFYECAERSHYSGNPELRRAGSGLWLRRRRAAQFVIVYAYIPAKAPGSQDMVSISAIKHGRVANVFHGVRELPTKPIER